MAERTYLDANATTPVLPEVLEAMLPYWKERFGNASSVHQTGQRARSAVDHAREQVASLLGCTASEIIFTSGGTESDNTALFGLLSEGDHLIATKIEHHAVLHAAQELEKRGVEVTYLAPAASGAMEVEAVQGSLRPNTKLVSVMFANNETGVINPIVPIAFAAHQVGALMHTDAVQGAGKTSLNVRELGCDLLSLSGHKMHAPQGTGALFVRKGIRLRPLMFGGAHERERRAGTENLPGIVGLGLAAEMASAFLRDGGEAKITSLRDQLETSLLKIDGVSIVGGNAPRICNTLNLRIEGVDADALVIALDLAGIAVSAGSACSSGSTEPSHVLLAMGMTEAEAKECLRISLSRLNTQAEVERAAEVIPATIQRLRNTTL